MARVVLLLFIGTLLLCGCGRSLPPSTPGIPPANLPALPPMRTLEPGVQFAEVPLPRIDGRKSKLWVYLPEKRSASSKLPCVLIAPAGSSLFWGMSLGDGDRPEHLPYVRAGFAVVAYELDGPVSANPGDREVVQAVKDFQRANFGLLNAQTAVAFASRRLPIDTKRIYVAGHSSAATLALQITAAGLPNIKACMAYAPCVDLKARIGEPLAQLRRFVPGIESSLLSLSPDFTVQQIRKPVFLFHARDDSTLPFALTERYANTLKKTNSHVTFVVADSGDHYDSMIEKGVPAGIRWLKGIDAKLSKGAP